MYPNISPISLSHISLKTPPESPRTPRSNVSSESSTSTRLAPVYMNNRAVYVPESLKSDVFHAADRIRSDCFNALTCKKEVLLDPDILIALLNDAKLYWYAWLDKKPAESSAIQRLESVFIYNRNLSKEESDWVRDTIRTYKKMVNMTIAKSNSNPIPPIRMVSSVSSSGSRCCAII